MKKTLIIITGLSLYIHSISPCTGDGGDYDYDKYGKRKYHDYTPTTEVAHSIVTQPSSAQARLPIYSQPTPVHIMSLKSRAEKAIKSDRLPVFKSIIRHSDLKKYPDACQGLFKKIVSHWTHLRNGPAYLVRLEKEAGNLPDLTKKMLGQQMARAFTTKPHNKTAASYNKTLQQLSKHRTFLVHAKNMKIEGKSYSALEYMQRLAKEVVAACIPEYKAVDENIRSRDRALILHLYNCLQIAEDPLTTYEA